MTRTTATASSVGDLENLIPDWERSLRAANKSPKTLKTYSESVNQFLAFLKASGMPTEASSVTREHVETWIEQLLGQHKAATASVRYRSLAQLWKYLIDEGEVKVSPMAHMKPPTIPEEPVPVLADADLRKLFAACDGRDFEDRRDAAMIRLLADTGMRASELIGLRVDDVDRDSQVAFVVGKGRRPRACPYGAKTATAIDRYLRLRARHSKASSPWLWVGPKGQLTDSGLRQLLERRGEQAGIGHIHPHQFRHTYAHRFLTEGGNEGDLMMLAGWRSRQMLQRYGASAAAERAQDAYRRMGMGDRL